MVTKLLTTGIVHVDMSHINSHSVPSDSDDGGHLLTTHYGLGFHRSRAEVLLCGCTKEVLKFTTPRHSLASFHFEMESP